MKKHNILKYSILVLALVIGLTSLTGCVSFGTNIATNFSKSITTINGVSFDLDGYDESGISGKGKEMLELQKNTFFDTIDNTYIYAKYDSDGSSTNHVIIIDGETNNATNKMFTSSKFKKITKDNATIYKLTNPLDETFLFIPRDNGNTLMIASNNENIDDIIVNIQ